MKVLIVDDNPAMRRLIKRLVLSPEDDCVECADGAQALAAYRQQRPDWVLMDIEMPVMDGLSATRQIIAAFPDARIVIVTRHEKLRATATAAGAMGYVLKENLIALRPLISKVAPTE